MYVYFLPQDCYYLQDIAERCCVISGLSGRYVCFCVSATPVYLGQLLHFTFGRLCKAGSSGAFC